MADDPETLGRPESTWAFEFEEPAYLTIGRCYQKSSRFSGGAYNPVVKRVEAFFDEPIGETGAVRMARADKLLELDKAVNECVKALKDAGLQSTYLKPFVVARINPLRFVKAKRGAAGPIADFDETLDKMLEKARSFDASKIKATDLAKSAGGGGD